MANKLFDKQATKVPENLIYLLILFFLSIFTKNISTDRFISVKDMHGLC